MTSTTTGAHSQEMVTWYFTVHARLSPREYLALILMNLIAFAANQYWMQIELLKKFYDYNFSDGFSYPAFMLANIPRNPDVT